VTLPFDNFEAASIVILEPSPSEMTKKEVEWAEELLLQRAEVTERAEKSLQKGLMRANGHDGGSRGGVMSAPHTPGPWSVIEVRAGAKRRDLVYAKIEAAEAVVGYANPRSGKGVAGVYADKATVRAHGVVRSEETALANAALIACSPKLLTALETLISARPTLRPVDGGQR